MQEHNGDILAQTQLDNTKLRAGALQRKSNHEDVRWL